MRVGHVVEVQRIRRGEPRNDADFLDAKQNQGRPHHVEPLNREEEHPKRDRRIRPLGDEAYAVVTDEHSSPWTMVAARRLGGKYLVSSVRTVFPLPAFSPLGPYSKEKADRCFLWCVPLFLSHAFPCSPCRPRSQSGFHTSQTPRIGSHRDS